MLETEGVGWCSNKLCFWGAVSNHRPGATLSVQNQEDSDCGGGYLGCHNVWRTRQCAQPKLSCLSQCMSAVQIYAMLNFYRLIPCLSAVQLLVTWNVPEPWTAYYLILVDCTLHSHTFHKLYFHIEYFSCCKSVLHSEHHRMTLRPIIWQSTTATNYGHILWAHL